MTDRLEITITGPLPDKGRHKIMAGAEEAAEAFVANLEKTHGVKLACVVRAVRPGKKAVEAVAVVPKFDMDSAE